MANGPAVEIDSSRLPIVVMTLRGALTDEDYESMYEQLETIMAKQQPYVMVTDLREVTQVADAKRRQAIAAWSKQMEERHGESGVASIMVLDSALVRGSLTALQWLSGKEKRDIWVGSMEEALSRAESIAREHDLLPPASQTATR